MKKQTKFKVEALEGTLDSILIYTSSGLYLLSYSSYCSNNPNWIINYDWDDWANNGGIKIEDDKSKKYTCLHSWKQYVGFTEAYWFCEKCDEKSKENPNKCF